MSFTSRLAAVAAIAVTVTILGCDTQSGNIATGNTLRNRHASEILSYTDKLLRISENYPQFAGFYLGDEPGVLYINLTEDNDSREIASVIYSFFIDSFVQNSIRDIRVNNVKYSFRQLYDFSITPEAQAVLRNSFSAGMGIDDRNNRIEYHFLSGISESEVRSLLYSTGIPRDALYARLGATVESNATLDDRIRPTRGGLHIEIPYNTTTSNTCTMSTIMFAPDPPDIFNWGFLTNSHCTVQPGTGPGFGLQNRTAYQSSGSLTADRIATEAIDPVALTGNPECTTGLPCRRSDAAYFQFVFNAPTPGPYNTSVRYKGYYTDTINSIIIATNPDPTYTITLEADAMNNQPLAMVGQNSGWSHGNVFFADFHYNLNGKELLHQVITDYAAEGGDSGAPVTSFRVDGVDGPPVALYGIHHSSTDGCFTLAIDFAKDETKPEVVCFAYYSPINMIELDMQGFLTTFNGDPA